MPKLGFYVMIERKIEKQKLRELIRNYPVTAIYGPRQTGKTTLAKSLKHDAYFDLENPRDYEKLRNPLFLFESMKGIVIIDEIQRAPHLFPIIRSIVDNRPDLKFIILGSFSGDIIGQSGESLAGRVAYYELGGLRISDISSRGLRTLWLRGGLPKSFLSKNDADSLEWRDNFIVTFLEKDIPQLGISIPSSTLRRFWMMLCHYHGQIMNFSELGRSFGISDVTARRYLEILEGAFMVRVLQPWYANVGKRIIKSPKIYFRDSGLLHALMSIGNMEELLVYNKLGASWEGFALESTCRSLGKRNQEFFFWGTHSGAELDLLWKDGGKNWGAEFKFTDTPASTRSLTTAIKDLKIEHAWIVYPGPDNFRISETISAISISSIGEKWDYSI